MELIQLRYFTEIAKTGNFTVAANNLNVAQSSVSRQINLLEAELGVKLFSRNLHGVSLTVAGYGLLNKAEKIIQISSDAVKSAQKYKEAVYEPLSIAFMDEAFSCEAANLIDRFKSTYSSVNLNLHSGSHRHLDRLVRKNATDIICSYYINPPDSLQYVNTGIIRKFGILMCSDDILSTKDFINSSTLENIPLIMPQSDSEKLQEKGLPFDLSKSNIIAYADNPFVFAEIALRKKAYIYCIEPTSEILKNSSLLFKPTVPKQSATMYFIRANHPVHIDSSNVFMEYAKNYFNA